MQRVSALLPSWEKTKAGGHTRSISTLGLERVLGWNERRRDSASAAATPADSSATSPVSPVHRSSSVRSVQREAFWPASIDKECERAAGILKSFCGEFVCAFAVAPFVPGAD